MMRRFGIVVLDAFQFQSFEHARLALCLLFQNFDELALPGHHVVQLLNLMFKVGDVRFDALESLQGFIVHVGEGSQFFPATQTTSVITVRGHAQNAAGNSKAASEMENGSSVIGSSCAR
jgi:hypothetical protein